MKFIGGPKHGQDTAPGVNRAQPSRLVVTDDKGMPHVYYMHEVWKNGEVAGRVYAHVSLTSDEIAAQAGKVLK